MDKKTADYFGGFKVPGGIDRLNHRTSKSPTRRINRRRSAYEVKALIGVLHSQHGLQPFCVDGRSSFGAAPG